LEGGSSEDRGGIASDEIFAVESNDAVDHVTERVVLEESAGRNCGASFANERKSEVVVLDGGAGEGKAGGSDADVVEDGGGKAVVDEERASEAVVAEERVSEAEE